MPEPAVPEPAVSVLRMLEEKAPTEKAPVRCVPGRLVCADCGRAEENEEELMKCGVSNRMGGRLAVMLTDSRCLNTEEERRNAFPSLG